LAFNLAFYRTGVPYRYAPAGMSKAKGKLNQDGDSSCPKTALFMLCCGYVSTVIMAVMVTWAMER